jgi:signal transduction histidine kinase
MVDVQTPIDILLVDDDDIDREVVIRLLQADYAVREAATAAQARMQVQLKTPDCVLLDYRLPDVDGLQLLPLFTQSFTPVIILTGEESPEVIVQAMQQGAENYLVKSHLTSIGLQHAISAAIEMVALKRDVVEKNRQLRELASALALAEQRERRRISQILHDHVQQILYGIQMRAQLIGLESMIEVTMGEAVREHLLALQALVREAILTTRTLTVELSPPVLQDEGLAAAFQWLANHMAERHSLEVALEIRADYQGPSDDVRVLLFQLVRELLFNVVKHAGVSHAELLIAQENNNLVIQVIDNGRGFDGALMQKKGGKLGGLGIHSVRERLALFGGQLEINTEVGKGVCATIILPREPVAPADAG